MTHKEYIERRDEIATDTIKAVYDFDIADAIDQLVLDVIDAGVGWQDIDEHRRTAVYADVLRAEAQRKIVGGDDT